MRVQNLTPFLFGTKVTSLSPPRPCVTVIVRAAYVLSPSAPLRLPDGPHPTSQGHLSADVHRPDDEERRGEVVYPSDFADFKPRADLLLRGTCHAPNGRRVTECPVRFSVGTFSKTLRVFGPRTSPRAAGDRATGPEGFTQMSLGYENAYGGPGHPQNPVGRGFQTREMPCVERPARADGGGPGATEPASFAPISPSWPPRSQLVGEAYGEDWRKKRRPFFAADFDFRHFNAAPLDQQVDYLRGDEEMTFVHLHPTAPSFSTRLPGLRVRAFLNDVKGRFREVKMVLDTLFADLDASRLYLTFRGVEPVEADDLADVRTLLLADEPLAESPRPEDHYRALLEAFETESPAAPPPPPEHLRDLWALVERADSGKPPPRAPRDPVSALLAARLGDGLPEAQGAVETGMRAARRALGEDGAPFVKGVGDAIGGVAPPGPPPPAPRLESPRVDLTPLDRALKKVARQGAAAEQQGASKEGFEQVGALGHHPALRALDPSFGRPGPRKPGREDLRPGADLSHRDLRNLDLTGVDLSGADLGGALLSGSCLRGAKLRGASLRGAMLFETDLTFADLTEADLTRACMTSAVAEEAILEKAVVDELNAKGARLVRARLTAVKGRAAVFEEADLTGAVLSEASLQDAIFDRATLREARAVRARLPGCRFLLVQGDRLDFERALLAGASFSEARLTGARLVEVEAPGSVWIRTHAPKADLRHADLREAHFEEANLEGATLRAVDAPLARFYRASLDRSVFAGANLRSADLCKAILTGAQMGGANLYDAKLLHPVSTACMTRSSSRRCSPGAI